MLLRGLRAASRKATALYDDALGKAAGNPNIKVGKTPWTLLRLAPWYSGARGRRFARNQLAALTSAGNSPLRCVKALLPLLFFVRCNATNSTS
jgi:hypothetical protein